MRSLSFSLIFSLFVALLLSACGTTVAKQEARFKRNIDKLDAIIMKMPMRKMELEKKKNEFKVEFEKVGVKTGDKEKIKALRQLNSRVESWIGTIDPSMKTKTTTGNLGNKGMGTGMGKKGMGTGMGTKPMGNTGMGTKPMGNTGMGTKPMGGTGMGTKPMGGTGMGTKPMGGTGMGTKPMGGTGMGTKPMGTTTKKPGMGTR